MSARSFNATSSRYGFNGKENDNETVGTGSGTQDYGMRIYNPIIGKFLSVDPIASAFPYYTPYQYAANKPIVAIDLDGLEDVFVNTTKGKRTISFLYTDKDINDIVSGNCAQPRIHYDEGAAVSQFEGPNKKNEEIAYKSALNANEDFIKKQHAEEKAEGGRFFQWGRTKPIKVNEPSSPRPSIPPTLDVKFNSTSDQFANPSDAIDQIKPIADFLKKNPSKSIDLIGNAGLDPGSTLPIGGGTDVLNEKTTLNGKPATVGELMKSRAAAIESVLVKKYGISDSRINTKTGTRTIGESGRNVGVKVK